MSLDEFLLSGDTTDLNYPEIRPTLDLNFARTKTLDPRITFRRASGGTYFGPDGRLRYAGVNEPRFDHNPLTGESLGLLVEEQRTNLNTNSEDFSGYGITSASLTTNQGIAPDGALTADNVASTGAGLFKSISGTTAATTYTATIYAKYISGGGLFNFGFDANPTNGRSDFNLQTGVLGAGVGANVTSRSITPVGNGWHRCSVTATVTSTSIVLVFYCITSGANFLLWGAQLEAGAFPTSYIPTTASAATRSADVASITGANFSSWYRQDEGTVFAQSIREPAVTGKYPNVVAFDGGTSDNSIYLFGLDYALRYTYSITTSGAPQIAFTQTAELSANAAARLSLGYAPNDCVMGLNGGINGADSTVTLPTTTQCLIGRGSGRSTISRLTYWPQRLPNATLQALTR